MIRRRACGRRWREAATGHDAPFANVVSQAFTRQVHLRNWSLSPQRQSTVYNCPSPVKKGNMDHNVKVFDLLYEAHS